MKPKPKFPFVPDCEADVLGKRVPVRFIRRLIDAPSHAWVQTAEGVFTIWQRDLYKLREQC